MTSLSYMHVQQWCVKVVGSFSPAPPTVLGHVTTLTLRFSASSSALLAVPALRALSCIMMSAYSHPSVLVRYAKLYLYNVI